MVIDEEGNVLTWDDSFWANVPVVKPKMRDLYSTDHIKAEAARRDCLRAASQLLQHAEQVLWQSDQAAYQMVITKARWLERRCLTGQHGPAKRKGRTAPERKVNYVLESVELSGPQVARIRKAREDRLSKRVGCGRPSKMVFSD